MGIEIGAKNLYKAYGVPALDLTFADKKSLVDRISGNNLITFTRSSVGTYVGADGLIKSAAVNEPRFDHNPVTGECLGLLVEEARTNLVASPTLSNTLTGVTNTAETTILGPTGTTINVQKMQCTASTDGHGIFSNASLSSGLAAHSIFVKKGNHRYVGIEIRSNLGGGYTALYFDFDTEAISDGNNTSATVGFSKYPNGWYRIFCVIGKNANAPGFGFRMLGSMDYPSWTATGDEFVYFYGPQLEAGAFLTSYIPTSGSTVTRAADVASITGTNFSSWYNNTEGTFVTDAILAFTQNAGNPFTFGGVFYTTVTGALRTLGNGGIIDGGLSSSLTSFSKTAVALKSGDFAIGRGGSITGSSSTAYAPTGSQWAINSSLGSLAVIKRLAYYPVRLPNATLQALTQ